MAVRRSSVAETVPGGTSAVDRRLAEARARIAPRLAARELEAALAGGALVVDTRPAALRERDGAIPGAVVVERNVLEWRLDPTSPHRLSAMDSPERRVIVVCDEGYASSLAAAGLADLGLTNVTDLEGGYQAWRRAGADSGDPAGDRSPS
jgi:rhodanese-related sulfurtransferase